jgi:hypothetical protein
MNPLLAPHTAIQYTRTTAGVDHLSLNSSGNRVDLAYRFQLHDGLTPNSKSRAERNPQVSPTARS